MSETIKLNLGCFDKQLPGFINVDIRPEVNPDVVDDAFTLNKFKDNYADIIYCCHMLEHLSFKDADIALNRWYSILKPKGILRLSVPNIEAHCAHYFYHKNLKLLYSTFWGSQKHEFDFHKSGWDYETLKEQLEKTGFKHIQYWDWRTTPPHNYCDDYSQTYFPHMDKENGKLMSLNIEATK